MSKRFGEQSRRTSRVARLATSNARYDQLMTARDKLRLVHVLRCAASRLEAEAKGVTAACRTGKIPPGPVTVTDHAVVRFMERVMGYDVAAIRREIARAVPANAMPSADLGTGSHGIHVRDGFQFLLTPTSVISILTAEMDGQAWLEAEELEALGAA